MDREREEVMKNTKEGVEEKKSKKGEREEVMKNTKEGVEEKKSKKGEREENKEADDVFKTIRQWYKSCESRKEPKTDGRRRENEREGRKGVAPGQEGVL